MITRAILITLFAASPAFAGDWKIVGYFAGWNRDHFDVKDIPAEQLTHVNYAFAIIKNGRIWVGEKSFEQFKQLAALKQEHPQLRTLISVGGWSGSKGFSDAALTDESRKTFAASCAAFVIQHGFDGVDIDWEYPAGGGEDKVEGRPQDTHDFTLLLGELRHQLDTQEQTEHRRFLLTIAAPVGAASKIELAAIHPLLDFFNLMTYDFAGPWSKRTGFNAPLYGQFSADSGVRYYLAAGVPCEKIILGVPFYARAWGGVKDVNHGLNQPHDGKWPLAIESGREWSYCDLPRHYINHGCTRYWDDDAKVPWLYDPARQLMISYDDPQSLQCKADYVRQHKLGGMMIWELSEDDANHSLLNALHQD